MLNDAVGLRSHTCCSRSGANNTTSGRTTSACSRHALTEHHASKVVPERCHAAAGHASPAPACT
eukprot:6262786-Prymnesium_polylepis.3